jgi:hypothetical protein
MENAAARSPLFEESSSPLSSRKKSLNEDGNTSGTQLFLARHDLVSRRLKMEKDNPEESTTLPHLSSF